MALGIFEDAELDKGICESSLFPQYLAVFRRRQQSHRAALTAWMADYSAEEKTPLIWLQHKKNIFESILQTNPQNSEIALKLQSVNQQIAYGDYSVENTAEFDYAVAKRARKTAFNIEHWPDSDEVLLRQQEEADLINQFENL